MKKFCPRPPSCPKKYPHRAPIPAQKSSRPECPGLWMGMGRFGPVSEWGRRAPPMWRSMTRMHSSAPGSLFIKEIPVSFFITRMGIRALVSPTRWMRDQACGFTMTRTTCGPYWVVFLSAAAAASPKALPHWSFWMRRGISCRRCVSPLLFMVENGRFETYIRKIAGLMRALTFCHFPSSGTGTLAPKLDKDPPQCPSL